MHVTVHQYIDGSGSRVGLGLGSTRTSGAEVKRVLQQLQDADYVNQNCIRILRQLVKGNMASTGSLLSGSGLCRRGDSSLYFTQNSGLLPFNTSNIQALAGHIFMVGRGMASEVRPSARHQISIPRIPGHSIRMAGRRCSP